MIRVHFSPAVGQSIDVEIADGREEAVIVRAAERVWPGPFDPKAEAESEKRYQVAKRMRAERLQKEKVSRGTRT